MIFNTQEMVLVLNNNSSKIKLSKHPESYDELIESIKIQSPNKNLQNIIIKYQDCDGDLINIQNTEDLETAYEYIQEEQQEQFRLFVSFEFDGQNLLNCQDILENQKNQNNENCKISLINEQNLIKKVCECFKQIELKNEEIFIECPKCKYYKEGINCKKCQGLKQINPSKKECNLINAILNYKIEKTMESFAPEQKSLIEDKIQSDNKQQLKQLIEMNSPKTEINFQQIKLKLSTNPDPYLFTASPSEEIKSLLTIQNLSHFDLPNSKLTCIQGFPLSKQISIEKFKMEETKQISIVFKAPQQIGLYSSCWKLEVEGKLVGPKIVLEINVKDQNIRMAQSQILCCQVQI